MAWLLFNTTTAFLAANTSTQRTFGVCSKPSMRLCELKDFLSLYRIQYAPARSVFLVHLHFLYPFHSCIQDLSECSYIFIKVWLCAIQSYTIYVLELRTHHKWQHISGILQPWHASDHRTITSVLLFAISTLPPSLEASPGWAQSAFRLGCGGPKTMLQAAAPTATPSRKSFHSNLQAQCQVASKCVNNSTKLNWWLWWHLLIASPCFGELVGIQGAQRPMWSRAQLVEWSVELWLQCMHR